ncbi:MAG: ACT domain-containing protein [Caldilineaceae bacterium]
MPKTAVLAEHDVNILDIGQAVIHDYLSLGLLVEIPHAQASSSVLKDLLFAGHRLGVTVNFTPVETDRYETWVNEQGDRRVITLLGASSPRSRSARSPRSSRPTVSTST